MFKSHQLYPTSANVTRKFLSNNNKATSEGPSFNPLQYLYTGAQQTTLEVPIGTTKIVFAGVAMGAPGFGDGSGGVGSPGGGGGAANLAGFIVYPAVVYAGTTLYIGVGGPASPRNTYVRTSSHSGPIIFELNQGSGGTGGAANPTYSSVAGGSGGAGKPRYGGTGGAGDSTTGSGAGGGGGGGGGDNSPYIVGGPGGSGGSVTMPGTLLSPIPISAGPTPSWTWGSLSTGGTGGPSGTTGAQAPGSGAFGGVSLGISYGGGGGGGGAGVILNGVSYGGGGGSAGGFSGSPGTPPMAASPGFLIVQLTDI